MQRLADHAYERRIALFGGAYSNWVATDAVVSHAKRQNVEDIWFLGDVGGFGAYPDRTVEVLVGGQVKAIQGNYDHSVGQGLEDCGCGYSDPMDNYYADISYRYTLEASSAATRTWMRELGPPTIVTIGAQRVLLCHGSPRRVNEFLWESTTPVGYVSHLCRLFGVDLIVCTHTGLHWQRHGPDGTGIVNVGAVGRPANDGRLAAWYTLLEATPNGIRGTFVPVHYDAAPVIAAMNDVGLPQLFADTLATGWWTTCLETLPSRERSRGRH